MTSPMTNKQPDDGVSELKPCPFCGSADIQTCEDGSPFSIMCDNCCAEMPYMSLDDPQSERWNTRTPPEAEPSEAVVERLWLATKHGDEDHQTWLRDAYVAFFSDEPVPAPRGLGNKEARIAELEAQVAALRTAPPVDALVGRNSTYSEVQIEEMEARRDHLHTEIGRCHKAIEGGDSDPWWREDRDRFERELRELTAALANSPTDEGNK